MGGLDGGSGVEPWEHCLFRADSKKTNTDGEKLEGEAPTMEQPQMQGVGEGSRWRSSVVRTVIKGVPANITTTWEPAEMPVLEPHPRPREPDRRVREQEGRGSASTSSWGCT